MYSRTTTSGMYGTLLGSLQDSLAHIQDLQRQLASNNKYAKLSDNPAAVTRGLELQSTITATEKYIQNGENAISMLNYSEGALNTILDAANDIRDLIIQADGPAKSESTLQSIVAQIEAKKQNILDALNMKIAGQYIFGGTDTSTPPFTTAPDGRIVYNGSDERIKYAIGDGLLGDVSFTGSEIAPADENTYFICSHKVPLDWKWTGREEKVQITVGSRTIAVFIPEQWIDEFANDGKATASDYNRFRDPGEVTGISLDDLATLVNRSLQEQGADMIVTASVEKNMATGEKQMFIKSNTGEKVGITGWTDTDYMPVCQSISGLDFTVTDDSWNDVATDGGYNGITGTANVLDWRGGSSAFEIKLNGATVYTGDLSTMNSISDLIADINMKMPIDAGDLPVASVNSGHLVLQSTKGQLVVSGDSDDLKDLLGTNGTDTSVTSSASSLSITINSDFANTVKVYMNKGDSIANIANKLNAIEGVFARTSTDGKRLVVVAERVGDFPEDSLHVDEAKESLHYPNIQIEGMGKAKALFNFNEEGIIASEPATRAVDHSHMDVFDVLGMETAMKSVEFGMDEKLTIEDGKQLHWRVMSGGHTADIKLNGGTYSMTDLATRIKNASAGWLEVTVDVENPGGVNSDAEEKGVGTDDYEAATQRLVIRGYNGEQVLFLDMNDQHYADKMGLSTALRTDENTGMKDVYFPQAPCVDDKLGVTLRVQMNCGMSYDVNITKKAVVDPDTGLVDRTKVMREIVNQVNAQEGENIMGITVQVDENGKEIPNAASIYFLSGESFTVVDMPFSDPVWSDYSGGIAAQLGIHGGVTANLAKVDGGLKDSDKIGVSGTIRFSNLAHEVEIDVSASDKIKDVMDRLRSQAGDWLYVNYFDAHMGNGGRQSGDYPIIAISSVDGSAVSVVDMKGTVAQDKIGLSTGIQGAADISGFTWTPNATTGVLEGNADTMTITVAGYTHTIDLTGMRDTNSNGKIDADDMTAFINARMQDYDVEADINGDGHLVMWSPRGYSIEISFKKADGTDATTDFLGITAQASTYYRGGYRLDESAETRTSPGIHGQNATIRSGANTTKQNAFGMLDDVIAAVKSGNHDALSETMLPRIDSFINNILSVMSTNGALVNRYEANIDRQTQSNLIMTDEQDKLVRPDYSEVASQLLLANSVYQANLAMIARIVQPSLLDFLS